MVDKAACMPAEIRRAALLGLGNMGDEKTDETVADQLRDNHDATVRLCAAQALKTVAIPGAAPDLDEGAALRHSFQMTLARRREGGGEFGDLAQRLAVFARYGAMCMREQHGVAVTAALRQHDAEPGFQRPGIRDVVRAWNAQFS